MKTEAWDWLVRHHEAQVRSSTGDERAKFERFAVECRETAGDIREINRGRDGYRAPPATTRA